MRIVVMGLIFGFVILTLVLGLFMGCSNNASGKDPQIISQMEELDKSRVMELAKKVNSEVVTSMNLPSQMTFSENMQELVFADNRKIAIITFQISFKMNDVSMGELLVSYIMTKNKTNNWSVSHIIARNAREKI